MRGPTIFKNSFQDRRIVKLMKSGDVGRMRHSHVEYVRLTSPSDCIPHGGSVYVLASNMDSKAERNPPHCHLFLTSRRDVSLAVDLTTLMPIGLHRHDRKTFKSHLIRKVVAWDGYQEYEKFLVGWLAAGRNEMMTNYQTVVMFWNANNAGLEQVDVRTFKIIVPDAGKVWK